MLQTIASPRRGDRLGANSRSSTPRPATTAAAAARAKASSTVITPHSAAYGPPDALGAQRAESRHFGKG